MTRLSESRFFGTVFVVLSLGGIEAERSRMVPAKTGTTNGVLASVGLGWSTPPGGGVPPLSLRWAMSADCVNLVLPKTS